MIKKNKLDKSFGSVGTSAGVFLFIAGVIITYFYISGLILVLLGAFFGFTSTSTLIDYDKKRVKFSNDIFGIIKIGKWINIESDMKIGIKKSDVTWRAYGASNQAIDVIVKDFRLILFDSDNKEIMQIKKTDSLDAAKIERETLSNKLGLCIVVPHYKT
ncbi:MAG: hypothetical protein NTX61_05335 [Bacteroidetes bacterium]|nr:hypothetical protein [Bacteroidota bacterium]